jgi:hypothetical protein
VLRPDRSRLSKRKGNRSVAENCGCLHVSQDELLVEQQRQVANESLEILATGEVRDPVSVLLIMPAPKRFPEPTINVTPSCERILRPGWS